MEDLKLTMIEKFWNCRYYFCNTKNIEDCVQNYFPKGGSPYKFEHAVIFNEKFGQECGGQNVDHVAARKSIGWSTMHNVPYAAFPWRSIGRAA